MNPGRYLNVYAFVDGTRRCFAVQYGDVVNGTNQLMKDYFLHPIVKPEWWKGLDEIIQRTLLPPRPFASFERLISFKENLRGHLLFVPGGCPTREKPRI